jgi:hypothetical protein
VAGRRCGALSLAFGACGLTDRFYGVTLELFRLRADAQPGAG